MRRLLAISLLALVCAAGVYAQSVAGAGAVIGIVRDIYGDGIPDVTVVLTDPARGIVRTMITSDDGLFAAPGLIPSSTYALKATKKGYADWQLTDIDVSIGETVNFRIPLVKADQADSQANPLSALAPVQDTRMSLTSLITETQVRDLPVKARLIDFLVLLAPTVTMDPVTGVLAFRGTENANSVLVDGINVRNTYYQRTAGVAPSFSLDSLQEVQVISAAGSADFGHASGGIVNAATRTATNSFHVGAYGYYDGHSMDAPDPITQFKPSGKREQAGLNVGTPIAPDRFFFFGNFETVRDNSDGLNRITNPLLVDSSGNVITSTCTATAAQCTAAANFIKAQNNVVVPRSLRSTTGFGKLDLRPNENIALSIEGNLAHLNAPNGYNRSLVSPNNGLLGYNASESGSTQFAKFGFTDVLSGSAVNEFRASWYKDTLDLNENYGLTPPTGPLAINVAGTPLGANPRLPAYLAQSRITGTDGVTFTVGSNTVKVGAEVTSTTDRMQQLYSQYGEYTYGSLTAFANDYSANVKLTKNYTNFDQTFGNSITRLRTLGIQAFAEDTWKATSRLLINGGLRWEKERVPKPTQPNSLVYQSGFISTPATNYGPRIGAAYMLDSRTVIRGGFGAFFEPMPGQLVRDLTTLSGVYETQFTIIPNITNSPVFPKPLASTSSVASNMINIIYAAQKFRNPYSEQGTAGIERRVNSFLAVALSYVKGHTLKLWTESDQNLLGATQTSKTYTIDDANGAATGTYTTNVFATNFSRHIQIENAGDSYYHGAVAQIRTAPLHGLSVQASYTWSHAKDDVGGPTDIGGVAHLAVSTGQYAGDIANSALDQRHRGVINWVFQPKFKVGSSTAARLLANGWNVSGTILAASSFHDTALVVTNGQQFTGLTMAVPTTLNGTGGWARAPFLPINSLPIGKQFSVDARVSKQLAFTERLKVTLLFEAFNATNHKNYTGVQNIAFIATSGVLHPVAGLGTPNDASSYPYGTTARRAQAGIRIEF